MAKFLRDIRNQYFSLGDGYIEMLKSWTLSALKYLKNYGESSNLHFSGSFKNTVLPAQTPNSDKVLFFLYLSITFFFLFPSVG